MHALSRSNGFLNGNAPCRGALRLFELREVAPGEPLSDGTQRLAVAVSDSSARPSLCHPLSACEMQDMKVPEHRH